MAKFDLASLASLITIGYLEFKVIISFKIEESLKMTFIYKLIRKLVNEKCQSNRDEPICRVFRRFVFNLLVLKQVFVELKKEFLAIRTFG